MTSRSFIILIIYLISCIPLSNALAVEELKSNGDRFFIERNYDEALKAYQIILEKDPDNIDALNLVGVIYYKLGDIDKSIYYFDKILTIQPDNIVALQNREVLEGRKSTIEIPIGEILILMVFISLIFFAILKWKKILLQHYNLVFFIIVIFGVFLRFYALDIRLFHMDEGAHGMISYRLLTTGNYRYDPAFHGPLLYYLTAGIFNIFGDSDYTARIIPAIFGSMLIMIVYLFRKIVGLQGSLLIAFILAISPTFLYYSRSFRSDILLPFFFLLLVISAFKYLENRKSKKRVPFLISGGIIIGLLTATKEDSYPVLLIFISYIILYFLFSINNKNIFKEINDNKIKIILDSMILLIVIYFIFLTFYTNFLKNDLGSVVKTAVEYWLSEHRAGRISGPFYYYLPILAQYELPIIFFGMMGGVYYVLKKKPMFIFFFYWGLSSLLIFSYIQEKVPWLLLHFLLPFAILSGAFLGEVLPRLDLNIYVRAFILIFLFAGLSLSIWEGLKVNYYPDDDSNESLTYLQTYPGSSEFLKKDQSNKSILIFNSECQLPVAWYLRHNKVLFLDQSFIAKITKKDYDLIIGPATSQKDLKNIFTNFSDKNLALRPGCYLTILQK